MLPQEINFEMMIWSGLIGDYERIVGNGQFVTQRDEVDKSMAGSQSSGQTDSGTTSRVMSTILTWIN